jgi:hypothetical protein
MNIRFVDMIVLDLLMGMQVGMGAFYFIAMGVGVMAVVVRMGVFMGDRLMQMAVVMMLIYDQRRSEQH